jgi:exodeoxyribonuclease V beta subunit
VRTLGTNWRSDGPLLSALDTLFAGATFGDPRIDYQPVDPAPAHAAARIDGPGAPLTIHRFGDHVEIGRKKSGKFYIDDARQFVAADVAAEIVRSLTIGSMVEDGGTRRAVGPADIAVLCRTRAQVDLIRHELAARNVPSVTSRTGGVYLSVAATEWWRLLLAIERPDRVDLVRLAATTLLVGCRPDEVASFGDVEVIDLQDRIAAWQRVLSEVGVPALVADIHRSSGFAARVLALPDGERLMTDFAHIADELHGVWRRRRVGSLASWLANSIAESEQLAKDNVDEPESRQRRLETDADAVQVQTVHGAKGLEYPVVFVPFAWDTALRRQPVPVFHDPDEPIGEVPRRRLIDVSGGSENFKDHVALAKSEAAAEEGRLLYVALTRAKHRLHIWWIEDADPTPGSKLTELIEQDGGGIGALVGAGAGNIAVTVLDDAPTVEQYEPSTQDGTALDLARFDRPLDHAWQRASFTSLSSEHPLTNAETTEQPLREDEQRGADEGDEGDKPVATVGNVTMPMAELPRGARFGTLVHEILERVGFDAPDLDVAVRAELELATQHAGWEFDHDAFVTGIVAAMQTPLGPGEDDPRLCDLDPTRLLDEMRFDLPVRTEGGAVQLSEIADLFDLHLADTDPARRYAEHLRRFSPRKFRGYLSGAIDLTAELATPQGPRFVVMDYKSNSLPTLGEQPSATDYGPGPLASAMTSGNYVLQATIYQVALHRYLQWRLPGYDPDLHLGGSMYLFVRGMVGSETPVIDGERCGVARWDPPASLVVAVSDLFKGERS